MDWWTRIWDLDLGPVFGIWIWDWSWRLDLGLTIMNTWHTLSPHRVSLSTWRMVSRRPSLISMFVVTNGHLTSFDRAIITNYSGPNNQKLSPCHYDGIVTHRLSCVCSDVTTCCDPKLNTLTQWPGHLNTSVQLIPNQFFSSPVYP